MKGCGRRTDLFLLIALHDRYRYLAGAVGKGTEGRALIMWRSQSQTDIVSLFTRIQEGGHL